MYFDTHAHYTDEKFAADRDAVLAALPARGIGLVLCPSVDLADARAAVDLAARYPHVYAAVGIHPEDCAGYTPADLEALRLLAGQPKVRAIGEVGLDYYWPDNPPRALQKEALAGQMALAKELDLPVIFHDREAHQDSLDMVRAFPGVRGVFHCYSGSLEDARTLLDLGWMLSFTGAVTFKNARRAIEILRWIPMDRVMIETDAPYLAPEPYRGHRNDSGYVYRVAETIAAVKELPLETVARATWENGLRFFSIREENEK